MNRRNTRILWLINHRTLRTFEVPLLLELGYEVFTPKMFPNNVGNISASVDYTYDQYLTIPKEVLDILNNHYFYNDSWSSQMKEKINQYFGVVITSVFPNMVNHVVRNFSGPIFLRVFGLDGDKTYANFFETYCEADVVQKIKSANFPIWLAPSYANTAPNEPDWLKNISVTLPLGLPSGVLQYGNSWCGTVNKILFVCPRINALDESKQIYITFKEQFGDLPYIIAGAQPVPVISDPNVLGFVKDEDYRSLMQNYKVMFYHSREKRHLHYHPLEAIAYGMPVIFMAGSMLDYLSGKQAHGRCENYVEARLKIERILGGDSDFIAKLTQSQQSILATLSPEYIQEQWKALFNTKILKC